MHDVNLAAIHHMNWLEYRHTLPDGRLCIRLRTGKGDWVSVALHIGDMYGVGNPANRVDKAAMTLMWSDNLFDYYEAVVHRKDLRISYLFSLANGAQTVWLDQDGLFLPGERDAQKGPSCFPYHHAFAAEEKPAWARGCVGYQIFPDRFRRSGPAKRGLQKWESTRIANNYRFGGNLRGIREAVPYLKELGVDMVYMTPIFLSDTSHRYNTFDYYTIDPLLGTEEDLRALVDTLHENGMRILLDGVFNHCGVEFEPFLRAKDLGKQSDTYDWFMFTDETREEYLRFGFERYMPKLNLQNPDAQRYFCEVGRYWIERCNIDGWRLDVSTEVWPDFWRVFRKAVRAANPDALLVAECWDDSRQWVTVGDMFDSTMHYVLSRAIWGFFAEQTLTLTQFDERINSAMMLYPHAVEEVLWNFLGSHDTKRMLTRCGGRVASFQAAAFFQMTHPGVPIIYYGDELGMPGEDDPDCRRPMPWDRVEDNEMLAYYKSLTAMRHASPALRYGTLRTWWVDERTGLYAIVREYEEETALCVLATGEKPVQTLLPLPDDLAGATDLTDRLSGAAVAVRYRHAELSLAPGQGMVFIAPHSTKE